MKSAKRKAKSQASVSSKLASQVYRDENRTMDNLSVRIHSLRLCDDDKRRYQIKVTFFDNLILSDVITPIGPREQEKELMIIAKATMTYDPSDYEKMCLFADTPMVVSVYPLASVDSVSFLPTPETTTETDTRSYTATTPRSSVPAHADVSWCTVDILPLFIDTEKMCIKKRLEPAVLKSSLHAKSWDNLPLLKMSVSVVRHPANAKYHMILERANHMRITLVGAYNLLMPYEQDTQYMAATMLPMYNENYRQQHTTVLKYQHGGKPPKRFDDTRFYPKWESLGSEGGQFRNADEILSYAIGDVQNDVFVDIETCLKKAPEQNTIIWGSFHRTLLMESDEKWLFKHLRRWRWPLEMHFFNEEAEGYSCMAFLNWFDLLHAGVTRLVCAVPLEWHETAVMLENTGFEFLVPPADRGGDPKKRKPGNQVPLPTPVSSATWDTEHMSVVDDLNVPFVIVEVCLARPLVPEHIPPAIKSAELKTMLHAMEEANPQKRECTGRGQLEREWQTTVRMAANALKRVPYHGQSEYCQFNRQLSETRTRVEIATSFWMDAAVFVNNNFVVQDYLEDSAKFEELLLMAHVVLTNSAIEALAPSASWYDMDCPLRAARHARHLQDIPHAIELYMQEATERPTEAAVWRELSTALKDVDKDWAAVCLNKSLKRDYRNPLTLLSKGSIVFETSPDEAEPFFRALITQYPFWLNGWVVTSVYYMERELFRLSDEIMKCITLTHTEGLLCDIGYARAWEHELGDWWEPTPLLPGMSAYYDAADLLLRLRAIPLAEACLARSLCDSGETAAYFHLVALCCRLRGLIDDALCHLRTGIEKFGEVSYLHNLEAECLHMKEDQTRAMESFQKAGPSMCPYSVLLSLPSMEPARVRMIIVDLLRRHPSSYAWMALAHDWLLRAELKDDFDLGLSEEQSGALLCATACAVQALKWDRRSGRAWALLAQLVRPQARRDHCVNMAISCGYPWTEEESGNWWKSSREAICYRLGIALVQCNCAMCQPLTT